MRRSDGGPYWHRRRCEHDDEDLVDEEGGAREGRGEQERLHRLAQHVPLGEERRERRARHEHVDDRGGEHEHKQEQPLRRVEAAVARLQVGAVLDAAAARLELAAEELLLLARRDGQVRAEEREREEQLQRCLPPGGRVPQLQPLRVGLADAREHGPELGEERRVEQVQVQQQQPRLERAAQPRGLFHHLDMAQLQDEEGLPEHGAEQHDRDEGEAYSLHLLVAPPPKEGHEEDHQHDLSRNSDARHHPDHDLIAEAG